MVLCSAETSRGLTLSKLAFSRKKFLPYLKQDQELFLIYPVLFFLALSGRWFDMTEILLTGLLTHCSQETRRRVIGRLQTLGGCTLN